jgi:hypothetical protein
MRAVTSQLMQRGRQAVDLCGDLAVILWLEQQAQHATRARVSVGHDHPDRQRGGLVVGWTADGPNQAHHSTP